MGSIFVVPEHSSDAIYLSNAQDLREKGKKETGYRVQFSVLSCNHS